MQPSTLVRPRPGTPGTCVEVARPDSPARGPRLRNVDLSDARLRAVYLARFEMRGVELVDVDMYGEFQNVTINGVDSV